MSPSTVDNVTPQLLCCVCEECLETVSSLHYHQTCYHTTEELSLALLSLKGLKLMVGDLEGATNNEDVMLRTGVFKYPHFLLNQCSSDSESTATAESSRFLSAIATLDKTQKNVISTANEDAQDETDKDLQRSSDSVSTKSDGEVLNEEASGSKLPDRSQIVKKRKAVKRKSHATNTADTSFSRNQDFKRKISSRENIYKENPDQEVENLILTCYSDDTKTISSRDEVNSETDSDVELRNNIGSNSSGVLVHYVHFNQTKFCISNSADNSGNFQNVSLDVECLDKLDAADKQNEALKSSPSRKGGSVSSPSSVDSFLSPSNSPHPESHIKAIITRLPSVVTQNVDLSSSVESEGRGSRRKKQKMPRRYINDNYVIPSPVSRYHRCNVLYDYHSSQKSEEAPLVKFDDFFVPNVQIESGVDTACETNSLIISEKQVQTSANIHSDHSGMQSGQRDKNYENNRKEECTNKETQTGVLSISTQKLAAYRKPCARKCQKEQLECKVDISSNNSTMSLSKTVMTVALSVSNPQNILSQSRMNLNNECSASGMLTEIAEFKLENNTKMSDENLMQTYPRETADRRFFCEPCGRGYKKKFHLERHLRIHTGERPFQCPHCGKRFAARSILKQHVRTHTGEKPYCCAICMQRFPQKSGLTTHTMLHTGKPFKCDRCDKAFVSNHRLTQHLRSHGGPRKHVCQTCSTEFFTEGAMKQHALSHRRRFAQFCMLCGAKFEEEALFRLHLDMHLQRFSSITAPR